MSSVCNEGEKVLGHGMREELKWSSEGVLKVVGTICDESLNDNYPRSFSKWETLYYKNMNQYENLTTVKI